MGHDRKRSARFDFGEFDEHCIKEPDRAFTSKFRYIHFPQLKWTNIHLRGTGDMIRLEIITVPLATLATVNAVITFTAVVLASTVSGFMVFIQAYITEDLDDYTTMQPLIVWLTPLFSRPAGRWLLVVDVHYTKLRSDCSRLDEHIEIITSLYLQPCPLRPSFRHLNASELTDTVILGVLSTVSVRGGVSG